MQVGRFYRGFKRGVKPERYESPDRRPKPSPVPPKKRDSLYVILLTAEVLER